MELWKCDFHDHGGGYDAAHDACAQGRDSQPRRKGGVGDEKGQTFLWENSDGTDTDLLLPSDRVYGHLFIQQRKVADQFFGIFSALVPAYDGIAYDDGVSVYDIQYCPDRDGNLYGCGYDLGDRPVKVKENRSESDGTGPVSYTHLTLPTTSRV